MVCETCDRKNPEYARFCADCGTQLGGSAEAAAPPTRRFSPQAPQRTKRNYRKLALLVSGALFALVLVCGGVAALTSGDEPHTAAIDAPDAAAEAEGAANEGAAIPEQQAAFIQTVEAFATPYQEAENELQGSAERAKRRAALAVLLPDRAVQGWTGTLESLDTTSKGNAYVSIRPEGAEAITVATWTNALRDADTNSLIPMGSALYRSLADMSVGDHVIFSGTFAASEQDHLAERSENEAGSMTTPGVVMVFSDITHEE